MRAHCPVRRLTAPVWLSTSMCLHISPRDSTEAHLSLMSACPRQLVLTSLLRGILSRFPNAYSLNANTNVRNTFSENIYTPGGLGFGNEGGCSVECIWESGIERIRGRGVGSPQVGVGYGWVTPTPMFTRPPALLVSLCLNAWHLRQARKLCLALVT